jgi:hypothetical protein
VKEVLEALDLVRVKQTPHLQPVDDRVAIIMHHSEAPAGGHHTYVIEPIGERNLPLAWYHREDLEFLDSLSDVINRGAKP